MVSLCIFDSKNNHMKVKEVINYLDSIAPPEFQENYDNCGLIVGNPENTVSGIVVCLDCTEK